MPTLGTTQPVPLVFGEDGVIRLAGSRVTLDFVVYEFKQGATAEQIQEDYPSLTLGDIYACIAYYLQNTSTVDEYLRTRAEAAAQLRQQIEATQGTTGIRERLLQRRTAAAK